jgi:tight adherence protein C
VLATLSGCAAAAAIVELAAVAAVGRGGRGRDRALRVVGVLARLGRRAGVVPGHGTPPRDLAARLEAAGSPLGLSVGDIAAVKGGAALVGLLGGAPLAAALPGRLPLVAIPALPVAGFMVPEWLLARRAGRRRRDMEAELAGMLDLLRVSIEAGLPVGRALGEVGRRHGGVLAREWRRAAAELQLGVPRDQALTRLARRCPAPAVATLVAALRRAERHGAPLAETLAAQAREARSARARRMREQAARAAPKIQLVVALLLVPSVLLLVAAALVASLLSAG